MVPQDHWLAEKVVKHTVSELLLIWGHGLTEIWKLMSKREIIENLIIGILAEEDKPSTKM